MTDNHEYNIQQKGDTDWHIPLNDTIRELDREVPIRDKESNLNDYTPKAEATFIATDTGAIYSADGSNWYLEDTIVSNFEAKDSITFPDGSTVTSPGSGSAVDFEEEGSVVVQNASAANFVEAGAATVNVTDDTDGTVTIEVSATDTNTERTNEEIEDLVASLVSGGTNITTTYDDASDTLTFDGLSDEQIQDIVGAMAGNNLSYDDSADLLNATDTNLTDEEVQDIVGPFITGGSNVSVTYDDAGNVLTVSATDTNLTSEEVQDIIGGIVNVGLSYDDAADEINLTDTDVTVAGNTVSLGGSTPVDHADLSNITASDHHTRYSDTESQDAVGTILGTHLAYDSTAPSITIADDTVTIAGNTVNLGGSAAISHADLSNITADAHHTRYTTEEAQDDVGNILGSNFTYNDSAPSINLTNDTVTVAGNTVSLGGSTIINHADLSNISADDHHAKYTDEEAQDAVGNILGSNFTYSDATPAINLASDTVTVAGNAVDLGGTTDVAHADLTGIGSGDHHTRYSDEEAQDAVGTIFGSTLTYSDSTPSMNVADNSIGLGQLANPFNLYNLAASGGVVDIGSNDLVADTSAIWNESNDSITADINTQLANTNRLFFPDTNQNPSVNGQMRRNGNDILAYSGGSLRNLSNIGSGGTGAPSDASYLTTQSETDLSNETVIDAYPFTLADLANPFSLATLTDLDVSGNDLVDSGTVIWDTTAAAVPQAVQGGPAGDLSGYPLSSSDLDTGSVTTDEIANGTILEEDLDSSVAIGGFRQVSASSSYTASAQDSVWADASSSNVTVTLPSPSKSAQVRVVVVDDTNGVSLSENGSEGIQVSGGSVSSIELQQDEVIIVESNGTTWDVVARIEQYLATGTLGTLSAADEKVDTTVTAVASDVTTPISAVDVYPADGQSLSGEFPFHAEFSQIRDYTNSETDVFIRATWDTDSPPADIDLVYEIHGENAVAAGSGATQVDIEDGGSSVGTADTINAGSNLTATVSGGTATLDASGGGGGLTLGTPNPITSSDSPVTATAGEKYRVSTNGGNVTVNLPGTPSEGDRVKLYHTLGGNTLTVDGNGSDIESEVDDKINGQYTTKIYEYIGHTSEWVEST